MRHLLASLSLFGLLFVGCNGDAEYTPSASRTSPSSDAPEPTLPEGSMATDRSGPSSPAEGTLEGRLRMAVTTSTNDTGLLEDLLKPEFAKQYPDVELLILPMGTGKALGEGEAGNVDVVLVHARAAEDAFMDAGHGIRREDVMYNSFEILGPPDDPAGIKEMNAPEALQKIAEGGHRFVSRGDDSGTHKREMQLWEAGGGRLEWDQYFESGAPMGATLTQADQRNAYTLSDRGTYLKRKAASESIDLVPLAEQSDELRNPYGIIVVNPEKNDKIRPDLADAFVDFIIASETQKKIQDFKVGGEQLFYPLRLESQNSEGN